MPECVLDNATFSHQGCFYAGRSSGGKRICHHRCAHRMMEEINALRKENETLKRRLEEVRNEV